jgi:peptidoglycan/LPS O-acetylase OafA/YrhL
MLRDPIKTGFSIDLTMECMRGFSALWVFMYHIADIFKASSSVLYIIAQYGYQGVAIFFVISGYCIYAAAENALIKRQHPNMFLTRRLVRVMPPFWASIIFLVGLPFFLEALSSFKSGIYISPSPRWLQFNSVEWFEVATLARVFFSKDGNLQSAFSPINAVYWSLAIELQLYFVMYVTLFFKLNQRKILLAIFFVGIFISTLPIIKTSGLFFSYWPAFFFGIALRWAHQHRITPLAVFKHHQEWVSVAAATFLLSIVLIFIFSDLRIVTVYTELIPNFNFVVAAGIAATLLWLFGGVEHARLLRRINGTKKFGLLAVVLLPLCWIGQSSYSLYLLHGQLYHFPEMFVRQVISPRTSLYPILIMSITACLCFIYYKFVEVPFQSLARNMTNPMLRDLPYFKGLENKKIKLL